MIASKPNIPFKNSSHHDKKELQILQELNQLDLKLKKKVVAKQTASLENLWRLAEGKNEEQLKKWGNDKTEAAMQNFTPHMEYFSQICNQDIDEDSLFDTNNCFLRHTKLPPDTLITHCNANNTLIAKKKVEVNQGQCSFGQQQEQITDSLPNYGRILKERNYVYKKEAERHSSSIKQLITQKNTKANHEKKTLNAGKKKERAANPLNFWQNNENTKLKIKQSQKYNLKCSLIEQQIRIQQQQLHKFQTFESFLSKAVNAKTQNKSAKKTRCAKGQAPRDSLECTFKPSILKKSSQMVKSTKNVVERLSKCNQQKQKKPYIPQLQKPIPNKQRIERLSQPRQLKTQGPQYKQQIPSFRPNLSKKSLEQMSNCMYDVATRNQLWLQQRKEKLQRLKQEQQLERSKRQSCTYSPAIRQYKGQNDPNFSRFGKQGIVNYFERLSGANRNLGKSRRDESFQNKENRSSVINQTKGNYSSKVSKRPNYDEAVRQLHTRIMGLKI